MENRYVIRLSSSDKLLIVWKQKVAQQKKNAVAKLVKYAILNFIETGNFINIGRIHFHSENVTVNKDDTIIIQTVKTPLITQWIEANKAVGLGVSEPIKLILQECISIIPDTELEYLPVTLEESQQHKNNMLSIMRENANKVTKQGNSSVKKSIIKEEGRNSAKEKEYEVIKPEISPKESASEGKNIVEKVSADSNNLVKTGLNGLLPKRATKKD